MFSPGPYPCLNLVQHGVDRITVCEIFACDLETGVWSRSRSSKAALFDRAHTTLYSSSIVKCLYLLPFSRYSHILVEIGASVRGGAISRRFTQQPSVT